VRTVYAGLVAFSVGLVATSASAAPRRFALEPLHVSGNVTAAERQVLDERVWSVVELMVAGANDELIHIEDVQRAVTTESELSGCTEVRCRLRLGDLLSADRVLSVTIVRSGPTERGDWAAHLEQLEVKSAEVLPSSDAGCKSCTAASLAGDLSHAVEKMLPARGSASVCKVHVSAEPPGGLVAIDGVVLGTAPFTHGVASGRRVVSVTREGSLPGKREVDCPAGREAQVVVTLVPVAGPAVAGRRSPALKIVGAVLLGLGVVGVGIGAYDLSRDGVGTCDRSGLQKRCPQVYDTSVIGGALVGVGAAAIIGGVTALVVDAVRKPPRLDASLHIGSGGAELTLTGVF